MTFETRFDFSIGSNFIKNVIFNDNIFSITKYAIDRGLEKPFKILQIADLHGAQFGINNSFLTAAVKGLAPDIVVLTGDTVSAGGKGLTQVCCFLKELSAIVPVFGILGNHERRLGQEEFISQEYEKSGIKLLKNKLWHGKISGQKLDILGVCEDQGTSQREYFRMMGRKLPYQNLDRALNALCEGDGLKLLLSHFPENFALTGKRRYRRFPFDVMFAGHAHGGQIRLADGVGIYSPGQGFFPKYSGGIYCHRNTFMVVSRGLGNDHGIPRINNTPEIVLLTIN